MMPIGPRPTFNAESVRRDNRDAQLSAWPRVAKARRGVIGPITKGCDIFGLTKGDFSMIDILRHIAREIGPCHIDIGTWTAAAAEIKQAFDMLGDKNIRGMRWLVDRSFPARQGKYYRSLLDKFGQDSVRLARFHAKFILLENDDFSVAVRTSMNLNLNARIEFLRVERGKPNRWISQAGCRPSFAQPSADSYGSFKDLTLWIR